MNRTRTTNNVLPLSILAVAALTILIGFALWVAVGQTQFDFISFFANQGNQPASVAMKSAGADTQGLAIYHASERSAATMSRANKAGLELYQRSERTFYGLPLDIDAGMEIYRASERVGAVNIKNAGLALYRQSEWSSYPVPNVEEAIDGWQVYRLSERSVVASPLSKDAGLAIYHASEHGQGLLTGTNEEGMVIYLASEGKGGNTQP